MKYNEYLESARRHSYACRLMRDRANDFSDEDRNTENFKHLVCSLYYLSGYVIECSLKFKIFECCGFDSEIDIDDEECRKVGINYRKKIKTHSFTTLQNYLNSKISGITHESDDIQIVALLENWSPEIRYETRELDFDLVKNFHEHASKFLRIM
ncbi:hypothetical protein [Vibrio pacinii]|uniref:hypothetical protein n=1 Tax=Vibrio pacinii TaxID=170674 RepID=UPI0012FA50FE|nr:hypothetical protein [Vibrio pacinii]